MRSRCEFFLERLGAYLDGELEPKEATEVENHLESCPRCRRVREEMLAAEGLLRDGLNAEEIDPEREGQAAARLLARLREEPEPTWARGRRRADRGSAAGGWERIVERIRSLRPRPLIGWAGGLAVATAAVLLAIRLGMPNRPVASDSIRKDEVEQAPVARNLGQISRESGGAPQQPEEKKAEPSVLADHLEKAPKAKEISPPSAQDRGKQAIAAQTPESAPAQTGESSPALPREPSPAQPLPSSAAGEKSAETPQISSAPAQEGIAAVRDTEESGGALHFRGGRGNETAFQTDKIQPAPAEKDARTREQAEARRSDTIEGEGKAKEEAEPTGSGESVPAPIRTGRPSEPTTWGAIQTYTNAPVAGERDLSLQAAIADSAGQGIFTMADTLRSTGDLALRLERGSLALAAEDDSDLEPAARAQRWRMIGDLWDWLAQRDGNPLFFDRAWQAYENGIRIDAAAGSPDSIHLARVRLGARSVPNPAKPGNKAPAPR